MSAGGDASSRVPSFTPSRELYPFRSRWFDAPAGRLHYLDEGDGPPIVLLHGNPTWSFLYRDVVRRLAGRFRCIAPDHLGFGLSERPAGFGYTPAEHAATIGRFVDHLGLEGFLVMGQDWGGPIGVRVAAERAERIRGLVLGNTWFWPFDWLGPKLFSRLMTGPLRRAVVERNFFVERLIPAAMARRLTPEELHHYRAVQATPEARAGAAEFPRQLLAAAPWLAELWELATTRLADTPLLLVWGMRDVAFPPSKTIPRITAAFADVTVVELPRAKHFIQEDVPEEVARAIEERFGRPGRPV